MFITFEGPEGSGKTTISNLVIKRLNEEGYNTIYTREPGGSEIAEQIRNIILNKENTKMDKITEALLFAASRRQHLIEKVIPALNEGKIVICDRYIDSSLAYQGCARNIGMDNIESINLFATEGRWPDLTIYFDIESEKGLARIASNDQREVNRLDVEKLEFHKKVREGYLQLVDKFPHRIVKIDASKSIEEVTNEVLKIIKDRVNK